MNKQDLLGVGMLLSFTVASAYGCSDDEAPADDGAGGEAATTSGTTGSMITAPSSTSGTTTTTGAGGSGDEGTSCADAVEMSMRTNTLQGTFYDGQGVIGEPDDFDYFTFTAVAGEWIRLSTDTSNHEGDVNTVITLFDESGDTQLAQNNNEIAVSGFDSGLSFHVLETGTYCLQVEDWTTWVGNTPQGGPTYGYRAIMVPMDFDLYDFYNEDTEPNDTTTDPQDMLSFNVGAATMQINTDFAGTYATAADVDVYEWVAPTGAIGFNLYFTPEGTDGYGSTLGLGTVNVYESDGTTILAQLDATMGAERFASVPIVEAETYYIEVNAPPGASAGANDFYFLKFNTRSTLNASESEGPLVNDANNDSASADTALGSLDGTTNRHFVGGRLPVPDEDWWSFQADAGSTVALSCSSWRAGSGTRDATFEIYEDGNMTALESEVETEIADVRWSSSSSASKGEVAITTTGTHYLRVSATSQDANVSSAFYLCGIHVSP